MKMKAFGAGCWLLLSISCNPAAEEPPTFSAELFPVCFSVSLHKEILPFSGPAQESPTDGTAAPNLTYKYKICQEQTYMEAVYREALRKEPIRKESATQDSTPKSIPDFSVPEPTPSGNENNEGKTDPELSDLCTQIEYIVYAADRPDECLKHRHFCSTDGNIDFGIVYDTLPAGSYQVALVAHSSDKVYLDGRYMSFDHLSDTFYATASPTVNGVEPQNLDLTLSRVVGRIEFVSTDPVPTAQKSFTIGIDRYPDALDLKNGHGLATHQPVSFTHTFTAADAGHTGMRHAFFTFVPDADGTIDVKLTATGADGRPTRQRLLSGIRPEANRILRYTGRLYTVSDADNTFNLIIYNNGKWDTPVEEELPD